MMRRYRVLWELERNQSELGVKRKGFLGSDAWRMSRSGSLPGKDGFQTEETKG